MLVQDILHCKPFQIKCTCKILKSPHDMCHRPIATFFRTMSPPAFIPNYRMKFESLVWEFHGCQNFLWPWNNLAITTTHVLGTSFSLYQLCDVCSLWMKFELNLSLSMVLEIKIGLLSKSRTNDQEKQFCKLLSYHKNPKPFQQQLITTFSKVHWKWF